METIPPSWEQARSKLLREMRSAITSGEPAAVNLSIPKHTATAYCLRQLAYDPSLKGRFLPVVFNDGAKPSPFPTGILENGHAASEPGAVLRVGLMSFRHPELDYLVDLYVCRNLEIARLSATAEVEEYAFRRALETLGAPEMNRDIVVEVYHTGLEPMVVGFYRGVTEVLRRRAAAGKARNLVIRPRLFAGEATHENLTPGSPGANPGNYIRCIDWR